MQEDTIEKFMRLAIDLATNNVRNGGGPFGAVVVRNGQIVGTGVNRVTANCDPTAHAEILAIREAVHFLSTHVLTDCVLFTSCEPCPMCLAAIYWAHITTVYFGNSKAQAQHIGFDDSLIYQQLSYPIEKRAVAMHRVCETEALESFLLWSDTEDKIPY